MYRVKFWNPETGKGFIEGYRLARNAKDAVKAYNNLYDRDGYGIRAEYLGKKTTSAE
jgi:hypothetical protein